MSQRYELDFCLEDDYLSGYGTDRNYTLPQAVAWLQSLLDKVPPEHRDQSYFTIESESDYEGGYTTILRIGYKRDETEQEARERRAQEKAETAAYAARREAEERATFEALKRKFG